MPLNLFTLVLAAGLLTTTTIAQPGLQDVSLKARIEQGLVSKSSISAAWLEPTPPVVVNFDVDKTHLDIKHDEERLQARASNGPEATSKKIPAASSKKTLETSHSKTSNPTPSKTPAAGPSKSLSTNAKAPSVHPATSQSSKQTAAAHATSTPNASPTPGSNSGASCEKPSTITLPFPSSGKTARHPRSFSKRAKVDFAHLGQTVTGGRDDVLWTNSLDTCIGLGAVSMSREKVLTHIGTGAIDQYYAGFRDEARKIQPATIYIYWPSVKQEPTFEGAARAAQNWLAAQLQRDFPGARWVTRSRDDPDTAPDANGELNVQIGTMTIMANGDCQASQCPMPRIPLDHMKH